MKDAEIIQKIEQGDESALDYLYQKYYRMMTQMVLKNNGTIEEAEDIYQDALVVFWEKVSSKNLELTSKISTYIYSICRNLWLKELDRKKRFANPEYVKEGGEEMDFDQQERIKAVRQCIAALGETCQKVLTLYYFDGISMKEIAERMGFSNADTAKTKKYKCKKALDKKVLETYKASDFMD